MVDASAIFDQIVGGLETMANQVLGQVGDDRSYAEIYGWNMPAINRHGLAALIRSPIETIRSVHGTAVDDFSFNQLSMVPARIQFVTANALPHLPGGNAFHVYIVIESLVEQIVLLVQPFSTNNFSIEKIENKDLLPAAQMRRLKSIERGINLLVSESDDLSEKIELINDAHTVAENASADMQLLRDAREQAVLLQRSASTSLAKAENAQNDAEVTLRAIKTRKEEAESLIDNIHGTLAAATTRGLGEEFGNRALQLRRDVFWLGGVLIVTLGAGASISILRLQHINDIVSAGSAKPDIIWPIVILSLASIAAPVWLGWLLTKQIGQRFRLSEDYAFKASIARAYAGYSREAALLDPEFQKQLYRTALTRIDEEPLRYVELDNHGSPLHEIVSNKRLRRALLNRLGIGEKQSATGAANSTVAEAQ